MAGSLRRVVYDVVAKDKDLQVRHLRDRVHKIMEEIEDYIVETYDGPTRLVDIEVTLHNKPEWEQLIEEI